MEERYSDTDLRIYNFFTFCFYGCKLDVLAGKTNLKALTSQVCIICGVKDLLFT
jgi:hypothetical protein